FLGARPAYRADEDSRAAASRPPGPYVVSGKGARPVRGRARRDPARARPRPRGPSGPLPGAVRALRLVLLRRRAPGALRRARGHAPGVPAGRAGAAAQGGDQPVNACTRAAIAAIASSAAS